MTIKNLGEAIAYLIEDEGELCATGEYAPDISTEEAKIFHELLILSQKEGFVEAFNVFAKAFGG